MTALFGNSRSSRLAWLAVFAAAMAWIESALVVYLRLAIDPAGVARVFPLHMIPAWLWRIELAREAATMVMLAAVAWFAETERVRRFAVFVFLFGVWDILYYVWLEANVGWPHGWLDWDVLYLIPWPWLAPWLCPALISALFVVWGTRVLAARDTPPFRGRHTAVFVAGSLASLASFLEPAARVMAAGGPAALEGYTPGGFAWWLYVLGLALMALGLPWRARRS